MSDQVIVSVLPSCDFAQEGRCATQTMYDFKTIFGPWANGCGVHWRKYRAFTTLGTGKRILSVLTATEPTPPEA